MIANDITLANATDGTSHVFTLTSITGRTSVRTAVDTASSLPHTLTIKHEDIVKGGQKYRRTLVRVDKTSSGDDGPAVASAYLVLEHPYLVVNDTGMTIIVEDLTDLLATSGVLAKLLNGEP